MDIQKTIDTLRLLKEANSEEFVRLSELAKELRCSKTELMAFVEDNPKLFVTQTSWKTGLKTNEGLLIVDAFLSPEDNYTLPDFLERLRKENAKTVHVSVYTHYELHGCYIQVDKPPRDRNDILLPDYADHRKNFHLWRNTPEKVALIENTGHCRKGYYWGGGDGRSQITFDHCVTDDDLRALRAEGWTIDGGPENL